MTFYDDLELKADASQEEVKSAWKRLAKATHPDVNSAPDAEASFKRIAAAYEVLSDPSKRSRYDTSLQNPPTPTPVVQPRKRAQRASQRPKKEQLREYWREQAYFEARIGHLGYWDRYGRFRR